MHATEEGRPRGLTSVTLRWGPVLALAVLALVTVVVSRPDAGDATDLSGPWAATVGDRHTTLELPGLFSRQGIDVDARVFATRTVVVPHARNAVYLESPAYAVTVVWDGVPVGSAGDPSSADAADRTTRSLVVPLPPTEPLSVHELGLDLRGDFGLGGVLGRMLLGDVTEIAALQSTFEVQRLASVLGMSLLGALPLLVSLRVHRPASLAYGAFVAAAAVLLLADTDLVTTWLPSAAAPLRLTVAAACVVAGLGVLYADTLVLGRPGPPALTFAGVCATFALGGLAAPADGLGVLVIVDQALGVLFLGWFAVRTAAAWRASLPGAALLVFAFLVVAWSGVAEIALVHGLRTGGSHLPEAALLFSLSVGAALAVRDAESSARYERLVRSSLDGMVTVSPDGRVEDANPESATLLGGLTGGASLLTAVAEPHRPLVRAHLRRAATRPDRCEFPTPTDRTLESLATPLGDGRVMLTLRDITLRREMDRAVLQAARLETAGVLVGGIAHDFNNMLSSVLAHVGLLRMQSTDARVRERLDKMEATVERASDLSRRLITVTRGTGSELTPVDLHTVCRAAADLAEPTLPAGITLSFEVGADLPLVLGAPGDLEQVLVNLLVNARDALGQRGRIRLCARPFAPGGRTAGVVVMVEDDGPGVPKDRRERIFEPFVTDKPTGTGLGLAVARQILRDHHGRIWVEERPGGGARFFLALRHADAVDEAPATAPVHRRVVVVEDEAAVLEAEVAALRDAGYEVVGFSRPAEAAQWLENNTLDLLVTDIRMPEVNGLELARRCRVLYPTVPVLFVTAFVPDTAQDLEPGTWAALHKPARAARLVATVGHLRRRAERVAAGLEDVTASTWSFPALDALTGPTLGF